MRFLWYLFVAFIYLAVAGFNLSCLFEGSGRAIIKMIPMLEKMGIYSTGMASVSLSILVVYGASLIHSRYVKKATQEEAENV